MSEATFLKVDIRKAGIADLDVMVAMQLPMALETEDRTLDEAVLRKGLLRAVKENYFGAQLYVGTVNAVHTHRTQQQHQREEAKEENESESESVLPVAMMMTTLEWCTSKCSNILWLQEVYVIPEFRRRGIFKQCYDFARRLVVEDPLLCSLRLVVDYKNSGAIAAYKKNGMKLERGRVFRWTAPGKEPPRGQQQQQPAVSSADDDDKKKTMNEEEEAEFQRLLEANLKRDASFRETFPPFYIRRAEERDIEAIVEMTVDCARTFSHKKVSPHNVLRALRSVVVICDGKGKSSSSTCGTNSGGGDCDGGVRCYDTAEVYVAAIRETEEPIGSMMLTFEYDAWREGNGVAWMQDLSVRLPTTVTICKEQQYDESSSSSSSSSSRANAVAALRQQMFRSFMLFLQQRVVGAPSSSFSSPSAAPTTAAAVSSADLVSIRVEVEPHIDDTLKTLPHSVAADLRSVAETELRMVFEDDLLMLWDKGPRFEVEEAV